MGFRNRAVPLLIAGFAFAATSMGQVTTGSIVGTVSDPTGAVITGAKVEITSQNTGSVISLVTNDTGFFKAPFVNPGAYNVKVSQAGFRTSEEKGVRWRFRARRW